MVGSVVEELGGSDAQTQVVPVDPSGLVVVYPSLQRANVTVCN